MTHLRVITTKQPKTRKSTVPDVQVEVTGCCSLVLPNSSRLLSWIFVITAADCINYSLTDNLRIKLPEELHLANIEREVTDPFNCLVCVQYLSHPWLKQHHQWPRMAMDGCST